MRLWLGGSTIVIPTVIAMPGATRHLQREFSLISDGLDIFADLIFKQVMISNSPGLVAYPVVVAHAFAHRN
ncbi:hypothetical protein [Flintibacter sp.]|uniref:hypothetical protein n=1 Tax=Flintibacter sp. TaxID=1918624 RepID=UPI003D11BC38